MIEPYLVVSLLLLGSVTLGLMRILRGCRRVEWLLALQLLGTTVVAVVMLLSRGLSLPGLLDLALVLGLLAASLAVAFVRYGSQPGGREDRYL